MYVRMNEFVYMYIYTHIYIYIPSFLARSLPLNELCCTMGGR